MGLRNFMWTNAESNLMRAKAKLLLVDEDVDDLLYYSAILQHLGYEVRSLPSYHQAAACLERENFDLVIVSQGSDNFEGRTVLAKVIETGHKAPVMVLTRCMDPECYIEAMECGALEYLEKPLLRSELAALVAKHLGASARAT